MTGLAGALFTPAGQAYFSSPDIKSRPLFGLVAITRKAGYLVGPALGYVLFKIDFSLICLTSAIPFVVFGLIFMRLDVDPLVKTTAQAKGWFDGVSHVFKKRRFLIFSSTLSVYFLFVGQLFFTLPMEVKLRGGSENMLIE
ncbi:hypothetical protein CS022_03650 [Veronia nyctiphanis]|uniref:Uncharacterized protein n=1 Tax=Veronia nyctiphanis TaxID=1278244 RepID=A0A4V1LTB9_9GAMM|nr:hypothetical protein [Veronia nyctiphanis]RXJ74658.1 hypothetical protein CS022_03650 [Veronia nyctiphanis]